MSRSVHSFGHDHHARLVTLARVGLALTALGIPCMLVGIGLFASVFFTNGRGSPGVEFTPAQLVFGMLAIAVGGFCAMVGLPTLFAAHADRDNGRPPARFTPAAHDADQLGVRFCKGCGRPVHRAP